MPKEFFLYALFGGHYLFESTTDTGFRQLEADTRNLRTYFLVPKNVDKTAPQKCTYVREAFIICS
jgi:hypothetical protein